MQSSVWIVMLAMYIILAFPVYTMAQKVGSKNPWFAFIPILNYIAWAEIAGKELWWGILMLIPCVNIVVLVILWMGIAERMGKPNWLGVLMIIPIANLIVPFYLAYG